MKQLTIVKEIMDITTGSYINRNNELILIPRTNTYFSLDDVDTELMFFVKLCEYFSSSCCNSLVFKADSRNKSFYERNTEIFNKICRTRFEPTDMKVIYQHLGNGCSREKTIAFVKSGFKLEILEANNESN